MPSRFLRMAVPAGLALALAPATAVAQAPTPVDENLIDGSECARDAHCQSGHCWQDVLESAETCKPGPPTTSALLAARCPEIAAEIDSWDFMPGVEFDSERREWPMIVRRLAADGTVVSESAAAAASQGEREGRVLAQKLGAALLVTGYDEESDSWTTVLSRDESGCEVLQGSWGADDIVASAEEASHRLGFEDQGLELGHAGADHGERVEILVKAGLESLWYHPPQAAPPGVDELLTIGEECGANRQCQSGWCEEPESKKGKKSSKVCAGRPVGAPCEIDAECRSGNCAAAAEDEPPTCQEPAPPLEE